MSKDFTDITITGVDEDASVPVDGTRYFDIHLTLSDTTPDEWERLFQELWEHNFYMLKRRARIEGSYLIITAPPEEMEPHHKEQLQKIVAQTNAEYRHILRLYDATEEQRAQAEVSNRARLKGLGKRLGF